MIYGIEQTTDLRHPETKIVKFSSHRAAVEWASKPTEFAWPGAARNDIPGPSRNFHHRLRTILEMPRNWQPPSPKEQIKWVASYRGSSYTRREIDYVAQCARRDGYIIRLPQKEKA